MIRWFKGLKPKRPRSADPLRSGSICSDDDEIQGYPARIARDTVGQRPQLADRELRPHPPRAELHGGSTEDHQLGTDCNGTADKQDSLRRVTFKDEFHGSDKQQRIAQHNPAERNCKSAMDSPNEGGSGTGAENLFDLSLLDALQDGRLSFTDFLHEPIGDDPIREESCVVAADGSLGLGLSRTPTDSHGSAHEGRRSELVKSIDDLVSSLIQETDMSADNVVSSLHSNLNISLTRISVQRTTTSSSVTSEPVRVVKATTCNGTEDATRHHRPHDDRSNVRSDDGVRPGRTGDFFEAVWNRDNTAADRDNEDVTSPRVPPYLHDNELAASTRERSPFPVVDLSPVNSLPPSQCNATVSRASVVSYTTASPHSPPAVFSHADESARPATSACAYGEHKNAQVGRVARQAASKSMTEFPRINSRAAAQYQQQQLRCGSAQPPDQVGRGSACSFRDFAIVDDQIGSSPGSFANINSGDLSNPASLPAASQSGSDAWLAHVTHVGSPSPCHSAVIVQQGSHAKRTSCLSASFSPASPLPTSFDPLSPVDQDAVRPPSLCSRRSNDASLDLFIPPPPPIEEDVVVTYENEMMLDAVPFTLDDEQDDAFGSPTLTPYSSAATGLDLIPSDIGDEADDPIIQSLLTLLPIREEQDLVPILSQAVGEIVTEIISTRRRFCQMAAMLEENKAMLHQQSCTIERQSRDIEYLKSQIAPRQAAADRTSTSSSIVRRSAQMTSSSRRESRQSQELRELNCTLESILFQCTTLQRSSQDEATLKLFEPIEGEGASPRQDGRGDDGNVADKAVHVNGDGGRRSADATTTLLLRRDPPVANHMAQTLPPRSCVRFVSSETSPSDEKFYP